MKSVSIYKYKQKIVLVPEKRFKSGFIVSQVKFEVIDLSRTREEIWNGISRCFDLFEEVEYEYDRDSKKSKNFNQELKKSVKAKSHKEFWQNSAYAKIVKKEKTFILYVSNRAKDFKGYEGYYLHPKEYAPNDKSILENMLKALNEASE